MEVGDNIRRLRKAEGMQQGDLADVLGYRQNTVSEWESGKKVPSLQTLAKIAARFGVTLDELAGRPANKKGTPATQEPLLSTVLAEVLRLHTRLDAAGFPAGSTTSETPAESAYGEASRLADTAMAAERAATSASRVGDDHGDVLGEGCAG